MRYLSTMLLATMIFALCTARSVVAVPQFYTVFKKEYLDNHKDEKFAEEMNKGTNKCLVCHQGKKSRKNHNVFGKHFVGQLDRKKDIKDTEKITEVLKKVLAMHVDPKDDKSETYLDRINTSKWPGGELKELMEEPKEDKEKKDAK